jgi:ferric-dicitrate binding protein FerR (iron transport regulator)
MTMKMMLPAVLLSLSAWTTPPASAAAPSVEMGPVFGSAQFQAGGSDAWFFARPGRSLPAGSVVKTASGSYCLVFFSDGTKLRLGPWSELRLAELSEGRTAVSLSAGRLEAWVRKRAGADFRTDTPIFTATLSEGLFSAEILSPASATFDVFSGTPTVIDGLGKSQAVSAAQHVELGAKTGAATPSPLPAGALKPQEPTLEGPAKPAAAPAAPAQARPKPKRAKPAAPPAQKSADSPIDSQL